VKSGAKTLVSFLFSIHPVLLRARKLLLSGVIGLVVSAHVHFGEYLPAWHPWEDYRQGYAARADMGGGVVLTQCHSLDYLPWLVGDVAAVWGFTGKLSDLEVDVEDTAKIGLRFAGGALGSLHLDYNRQPPVHTFEIAGTQGTIKWDLSDGATRIYRGTPHPNPSPPGRGARGEGDWEVYPLPAGWERNVMFMEQMQHFVAVVRGEVTPACPLAEGIRVQRLVEAVHESQRSGRVIEL
jgi:predicted dehydrogenase